MIQIESDEADWAVYAIACTYDSSKVGLCPHAVSYEPFKWWTRYPQETTKYWNLTNLFHPEAWMWTFLTFILVTVILKFVSVLGSRIGLSVGSDEVALVPFRWLLAPKGAQEMHLLSVSQSFCLSV